MGLCKLIKVDVLCFNGSSYLDPISEVFSELTQNSNDSSKVETFTGETNIRPLHPVDLQDWCTDKFRRRSYF